MTKNIEQLTEHDVLQELVRDVESLYRDVKKPEAVAAQLSKEENWPDLVETYLHAKRVLAKSARMRYDSKKPLKIVKWLRTGELSEGDWNFRSLIESLGNLLDHACSHDIFGDIIFVAEDGLTYVASVEGVIEQADPGYVKEILGQAEDVEDEAEDDDEDEDDGKEEADGNSQLALRRKCARHSEER